MTTDSSVSMSAQDAHRPLGHVAFVAVLAVLFVIVWHAPPAVSIAGLSSYLPLHILLETFSIVVSMLLFAVAWNSYTSERSGNSIILACGLFAVGWIDFGQMLSFPGMPDFVTPSGPEKEVNFWLAGRLVAAMALALAALREPARFRRTAARYAVLGAFLLLTALVYWVFLLHPHALPRTYIDEYGPTSFKRACEYAIIAILVVPAVAFYLRHAKDGSREAADLFAAAAISILTEFSFAFYVAEADALTLLGHVYKATAYFFIYRSVFVTMVREPFERVVISERRMRESQAQLARANTLLERVFESVHVLIAYMDRDFNFLAVNRAYAEADGKDTAFFVGKNHFALYPHDENAIIFQDVVASGEPYVVQEKPFVYPDRPGRVTYWDWRLEPVKRGGGPVEGVVLSLLDVTERVLARRALEESEEKFRCIAVAAQDAIIMLGPDGAVAYWNAAAERLFGYSTDEILGKPAIAMLVPRDQQTRYERILAELGSKPQEAGTTLELSGLHRDGSKMPLEASISTLMLKGECHWVCLVRDITARRKAQEVEAELAEIVRSSNDAIVAETPDGIVTSWNAGAEKIYGYRADEMIGKPIALLAPPERGAECTELSRRAQAGEPITNYETTRVRRDGTPIDVSLSLSLVRDTIGHTTGVSVIARDITEKKQAARALEESTQRWRKSLESTISAVVAITERRDPYTAGHQRRVALLATAIARTLHLPEDDIQGIHLAALVHDIGKIQVPAEILTKPGRLTELEYKLMQLHPVAGYEILNEVQFPWPIAKMVRQHHERWDGSGYPDGLKGAATEFGARIIAVADVMEAFASHRPYRPARGMEAALDEIRGNSGRLYDPEVVRACAELFEEGDFHF